jgi:hypothetical protein
MKIIVNEKEINLPISYSELTFKQWISITGITGNIELYRILTNDNTEIPDDILEQKIFPFLDFLKEKPVYDVPDKVLNKEIIKDLYRAKWKQKLEAQKLIFNLQEKKTDNIILDLITVFLPIKRAILEQQPVSIIFPLYEFWFEKMMFILENDKQLTTEPDPELEFIGAYKLLEPVQEFNLFLTVANKLNCPIENVDEYPYILIYQTLMTVKIDDVIQKKLKEYRKENEPK